jgi:hypothetical protein
MGHLASNLKELVQALTGKRNDLQERILREIQDFESMTGLHVTAVSLEAVSNVGDGPQRTDSVKVRTESPI